jgi:hypothetical protein
MTLRISVDVAATPDGPSKQVEATVDTRATYMQLSSELLRHIGAVAR